MTFNKNLVAGAVGTALTLGMGMQAAQADDVVLIPYVVKDTNRTTVVTLIGSGSPVSSGPSIHLQYWTKATSASNTAACEPNSTTLTFTENDIVTFDTAGILGSGPLFGDTTNAAPLGTSISYAGSRHGYLITRSVNNGWGSDAAYWLELDLANGGAHGDHGISELDSDDLDNSLSDNVVLQDGDDRAVPFWPTSTASTVFTVTPIGNAMDTSDNTSVTLQVYNNSAQGAYDRNENAVDGTVPQKVRCVGKLTAAQLMPGVVANAAWAAQGGWGYLANDGDGDSSGGETCANGTGDCDAIVYQVDTSTAAGSFMANATRITSDQN